MKEKYGDAALEDSSESSSEEEDEDGEGWTGDMEKQFLRTLSLIKNKDPSIYDTATTFYRKHCCQLRTSFIDNE